ncbi:MAG: FmdE family protein [Thermodesulfobacteriota bacterium]
MEKVEKEETKWRQDFFDEVETIKVRDPLAYILGAQKEGEPFVFTYKDAVKLAGHSCPAVSGAYKLTAKALKALYGDEIPVRSQIRVLVKGGATDLAYGPQAQVISLITGAAGITGFKGLGGRYGRFDKLRFDSQDFQFGTFIFQREDTGKAVSIVYNPQALPPDDELGELMPLVMQDKATDEEKEKFFSLWQGKVRKILLEDEKYPGLFTVEELEGFTFPETGAVATA